MTDLTEQWKKGELPEGYYYVKDGENMIAEYLDGYFYNNGNPMTSFSGGVDEVIALVPSYEEWKGKDDALTALLAEYGKLTKELQDEKEKHMTRPSLRSPLDEMVIEKQVWESTLHRSMVLQAENAQLKEQINKYYLDAINRGTANAVKAVKEFGMPERIKELVEQNTKLKELLKECELWFTGMVGNMNDKNVGEHNRNLPIGNFEYIFKEFSQKIKEALK